MSRIIVDSIRNSSASSDALTLSSDGKVAFPNNTGNILQTVMVEKNDVASMTSSSYSDIPGLSATITPSSTSSKILVTVVLGQVSSGDVMYISLTTGDNSQIIGGASVSGKHSVSSGNYNGGNNNGDSYFGANPITIMKLHSPSTTSAVTYKVRWKINVSTGYLNRNQSDGSQYALRTASTITLMEVA